eukprot:2415838-Alexandrium_andersonii.AAC.1
MGWNTGKRWQGGGYGASGVSGSYAGGKGGKRQGEVHVYVQSAGDGSGKKTAKKKHRSRSSSSSSSSSSIS